MKIYFNRRDFILTIFLLNIAGVKVRILPAFIKFLHNNRDAPENIYKNSLMKNVIFICGTNTGVGKTVLTGLLTSFARMRGIDAVAIKPFCSGDTADIEFLQKCQGYRLQPEQINPWFFEKPLSPYAAIYKEKSRNRFTMPLTLENAFGHIRDLSRKHEIVFVEGIGGIMVPIEKKFLFIDLIKKGKNPAILVTKNQLGVLNHVFMSLEIFKKNKIFCTAIVFTEEEKADLSANSNVEIVTEFSRGISTFEIPFLKGDLSLESQEKNVQKKLKKILAQILDLYRF